MRLLSMLVLLLVISVLLFIAGPRPSLNAAVRFPAQLPDRPELLSNWLIEQESLVKGLVPGTEKTIIWTTPEAPVKTAFSLLYLHGFSSSRQELSPVPENIARDAGFNLYLPRLPGHGTGQAGMDQSGADDWLNGAAEAWKIAELTGEKVVVIATSTGAPLLTWLLQSPEVREKLAAVIFVAPNFGLRNPYAGILTWPWSEYYTPLLIGREYSWTPENPLRQKYWTTRYSTRLLNQLQVLLDWTGRQNFRELTIPALFVFSPEDQVVDAQQTERVFAAWGGPKQKHYMTSHSNETHHLMAGDLIDPDNNNPLKIKVLGFLQAHNIL